MNTGVGWVVAGLVFLASAVAWILGYAEASTGIYAALGLMAVAWVAPMVATDADRTWLPALLVYAYMAKIVASLVRWGVLEFVYGGSGDATGYHGAGSTFVHMWRAFEVPEIAIGTKFMDAATGFLYIPHVPTMLGGFFLFATLAFFGQIMLYAAFRKCDRSGRLAWYAAGVFFVPTIVYWPSSIGKESLMFLFLGLASYGASGLLKDQRLSWAVAFGVGLAGTAIIRPHIALLLVASLAVAVVFGKSLAGKTFSGRRMIVVGVVGFALVAIAFVAAAKFGINFADGAGGTEDIDRVLSTVEGNTSGGGSGVEGEGISSPASFPAGFVKVLFRPFPTEATTPQILATSLEGMLLMGLLLWRLIPMLKNIRHIRRYPYVLFAFVFLIGFVIAFSSFNNFGLLARQRSQVMPYLLVVLISLGWPTPDDEPTRKKKTQAEVPHVDIPARQVDAG